MVHHQVLLPQIVTMVMVLKVLFLLILGPVSQMVANLTLVPPTLDHMVLHRVQCYLAQMEMDKVPIMAKLVPTQMEVIMVLVVMDQVMDHRMVFRQAMLITKEQMETPQLKQITECRRSLMQNSFSPVPDQQYLT